MLIWQTGHRHFLTVNLSLALPPPNANSEPSSQHLLPPQLPLALTSFSPAPPNPNPQLTVNCAALIICFIGAVAGGIEPLNVLQLLWVNLIMDTMGALALATEDPSPELLKQV